MTDSGLTTTQLSQLNCSSIYRLIYQNNGLSTQMICSMLGLSRPTTEKNLKILLAEGKIHASHIHKPTGGRPATLYKVNSNLKIGIGVELLATRVNIAAVNLFGEIRMEDSLDITFISQEAYFSILGSWINRFIEKTGYAPENILGVSIAIQGILDADNEHIVYSELLSAENFSLGDFTRFIHYPTFLIHDAEAAAIAEKWSNPDISTAVFLSLNPNIGSAVIINGNVLHSPCLSSGAIEHSCLYPGGELCYCGKRGCAEAYCSANSLVRQSGESISVFMKGVKEGNINSRKIWHTYLQNLALLIDNIRMVLPGDIVIGGLIAPYISDDDIKFVMDSNYAITTFKKARFRILKGKCGAKGALTGAALTLIINYLRQENLI